jgi:hypothetical protein
MHDEELETFLKWALPRRQGNRRLVGLGAEYRATAAEACR